MAVSIEDIQTLEAAEKVARRLAGGQVYSRALEEFIAQLKQERNRPPEPKNTLGGYDDAQWLWVSDLSGAMYRTEKSNNPFKGKWLVRPVDDEWGPCHRGNELIIHGAPGEKFIAVVRNW
jgi:hypothetical protein